MLLFLSGRTWHSREKLAVGMSWETGIREEMWRMVKKMAGCAESATVLDGEASKYLDVSRGSAKGCTLSLTLFKVFSKWSGIRNRSSKAASQGGGRYRFKVDARGWFRGDMRYTKRIAEANREDVKIHYYRKWRAATNVNKCFPLHVTKIGKRR